MIIGNGLIAKSIQEIDSENIILFCSGVSNSSETRIAAFNREINLISEQPTNKLFVYFSTISVYNNNNHSSAYRNHKITCEKKVIERFPKHIIIRLPNIVSLDGNQNNLFPFFYFHISQNFPVNIFNHTFRYLIDARDLKLIVQAVTKANFEGIINTCFPNPPAVLDLYLYMCQKLNKEPNFKLEETENHPLIDNADFMRIVSQVGIDKFRTSWQQMVDDYLQSENAAQY